MRDKYQNLVCYPIHSYYVTQQMHAAIIYLKNPLSTAEAFKMTESSWL